MVAPVTGPVTTVLVNITATNYNEIQARTTSKQKPPYDIRLPWTRRGRVTKHNAGTANAGYKTLWSSFADSSLPPSGSTVYFRQTATAFTDAYNTAYSRLIYALRQGNSANLGVSLAEAGESWKMIVNRLSSFTKAFRVLRKGNVGEALSLLNITYDPSKLPKRRKGDPRNKHLDDAANVFLEYKFGWAPLCSDIWEAYTVLTANPVRPMQFSVGSKRSVSEFTTYGGLPASFVGTCGVRLSCTATMTNPNLALANQLGLVNPLTVAWEVTTLSFLFDWFANVKKCLNSLTDMWGFTVTNCAVTRWIDGEAHQLQPVKIDDRLRRAERTQVVAFPKVTFRMRLPSANDPSLLGKAISLAALAVQSLSIFKR